VSQEENDRNMRKERRMNDSRNIGLVALYVCYGLLASVGLGLVGINVFKEAREYRGGIKHVSLNLGRMNRKAMSEIRNVASRSC